MEIENAAIDDHNGVSLPVFEYYKTLEKELRDEPENFRKLHLLLQDFKNKRIDRIGTVLNLRELLKHKLHLLHGFKKLLNEFDCVEGGERTTAELAFLFACQVKDHFGNDQRFETFSIILTKFRMNQKTATEVYEEMQELFGNHNELFEMFRKFYGVRSETMHLPTEPSGGTMKNQDGRKDCNKGEQNCNKSNLARIKVNFVKPKLPCKRKCIQLEAGGSVNNEMDRADKANSRQGDTEAEKERKQRERKGKAPVVYDEIVPKNSVSERYDSVQNDGSAKAKSSRGKSAKYVKRLKEELFKLEDDRYEFNMLQIWVASAAKQAKKLLKKIRRRKVKPGLLRLRRYFTPPNLQFIKDMYDDYAFEMIKILRKDPATALPVLLARLEKKKLELSIWGSNMDMIWRASSDRLFRELQGT